MTRAEFFLKFLQTLSIRDAEAHLRPLVLNEPQRLVWDKYIAPSIGKREPMRLLILKARQMGISTMIQSLKVTRFVWENLVNTKVIAHDGTATKNIWQMAERMMDKSPFQPYVRKVGTSMMLGDSRFTCATAGSPHATRSMNITSLHLSEVAFWEHPEAWLAALQTVPLTGESWLFVESTANGKVGDGQLFYEEWQRSVSGDSPFTPIFLPWYSLPSYMLPNMAYAEDAKPGQMVVTDMDDEETSLKLEFHLTAGQLAWRRLAIKQNCRGNVELFHQEYPTTAEEAFVQSGLPFFNPSHLNWLQKYVEPGRTFRLDGDRFVADPSGYVRIWKSPEKGRQYVIGADTSMGFSDKSHSRSTAQILDMETLEQCGEYDCAAAPHIMAKHLAILGRRYNEALLCPEVTASGGGGGRELIVYLTKEYHYYRLHRWKRPDRVQQEAGTVWGWETNAQSRPRMLARIREVILERSALIHSEALLNQLASFGESDTGRYEALAGHDDLLFAWGIALMSRFENYFPELSPATPMQATIADYKRAGVTVKPDPELALSDEWKELGLEERQPNWQAL